MLRTRATGPSQGAESVTTDNVFASATNVVNSGKPPTAVNAEPGTGGEALKAALAQADAKWEQLSAGDQNPTQTDSFLWPVLTPAFYRSHQVPGSEASNALSMSDYSPGQFTVFSTAPTWMTSQVSSSPIK